MLAFLGLFLGSALFVFCTVWWIHFSLGKTISPTLPDNGYYQASEEYKGILASGNTSSLVNFPVMMRDSLRYIPFYNRGAPRLDLCKTDENGSPFYFWPLGARTINYRWETPGDGNYRYLYLVPNPIVWWSAFTAVLLAGALLTCSVIMPPKKPLKHRFLMSVFLALYLSFMIAVSRIERVMYLYHYFIPLLVSFVLVGLVFDEVQSMWKRPMSDQTKTVLALLFAALIFVSHEFYRPLTYYEPLSDGQFNARNIFGLWDMHCVNCPQKNGLVIPVSPPTQ